MSKTQYQHCVSIIIHATLVLINEESMLKEHCFGKPLKKSITKSLLGMGSHKDQREDNHTSCYVFCSSTRFERVNRKFRILITHRYLLFVKLRTESLIPSRRLHQDGKPSTSNIVHQPHIINVTGNQFRHTTTSKLSSIMIEVKRDIQENSI